MVAGVSNVAQVIVDPKIGAVIGLKWWRRWAPGDCQNRRGLVGGLSEGVALSGVHAIQESARYDVDPVTLIDLSSHRIRVLNKYIEL